MSTGRAPTREAGQRAADANRLHDCRECGTRFAQRGPRAPDFCSSRCRDLFHRRRARRGAMLYDLFMAHRYERQLARSMHLLTALNRMAAEFRDEDRRERGGRHSWRCPRAVFADLPWLTAHVSSLRIGRRR